MINQCCDYHSILNKLVCIAVILIADITFAGKEQSNFEYTESCGPRALSKVLALLGNLVDQTKCSELAGTSEDGETTFAGIVMAAKKIGVPVKAMHLTPQELAVINKPSILHVSFPNKKEHYVVFSSSNGLFYNIFDLVNNDSIKQYTLDQLRLMWSGNCLVFSSEPFRDTVLLRIWRLRFILFAFLGISLVCFCLILSFRLPSIVKAFISSQLNYKLKIIFSVGTGLVVVFIVGVFVLSIQLFAADVSDNRESCLVVGTNVLDVGDVELNYTAQTALWLGNAGKKSLKIDSKAIKKSCNCVLVKIMSEEILAGDKSIVQIKLSPPRKLGPFKYSLLFPSQGNTKENMLLDIKGKVVGAGGVVYPPRLYFGRVYDIERTNKALLYILRRRDVKIMNATSDLPFVTCTFHKRNAAAFEINVSLTELPKPGPFEGTINIVTNDPEAEYAEIVVPLSGVVTPPAGNELSVQLSN